MADDINQQFSIDASGALKALDALNAAYAKQEQHIQSLAATMGKFNGSSNAVTNAAQQAGGAMNRYGQNARTLRGALDDVISVHGKFTTSLALASRIVFTQAVVRGFRQIRAGIDDTIARAGDFQKQLAAIRSIDSDKIFGADLGNKLRDLSTSSGIALPEIGAGTYEALSAQILRTSDDFSFLSTAADFSRASFTSFDDTVKLLAGSLSAFGKPTSEANRLASEFFKTVDLGNVTGAELAQQFGTVATIANQLGVSTAEVNAAFATLTNRGLNASTAATQIRGVFTGLIKPSEDLQKVLRSMGFENIEQAIKALTFGGLLTALAEQTGGSSEATAELFHNVRALSGQLALGGQGAETYAANLEKIKGVSSDLAKQKAGEVQLTDAERLSKKVNELKNDLIPIGDASITLLNKVAGGTRVAFETMGTGLAVIADKITGVGVNAEETERRFQRLADLLGKDLTVGTSVDPFTGKFAKIVSDTEIIQRRLEVAAKRRAELNEEIAQGEAKTAAEYNQIKFRELENIKARNQDLVTEAQSSANKIITEKKREIAELSRLIEQSRALLKESPGKIADIQGRQDRRNFNSRTEDLAPEQQSLALIQRAQDQERQANAALNRAKVTGAKEDIDRARALYEAAQSTGEEAQNLSKSAGDRRGALFAARQLSELTDRQVAAERGLAASAQARIPTLEQQKQKEQQKLALIQQATKDLIKNSNLFYEQGEKKGQQLPADQLAKQAEARQRAFATLAAQGVGADQIAELTFRTEGGLAKLSGDIKNSLGNLDLSGFSTAASAIQSSVGPANAVAEAYERAASAAAQLGNGSAPSPANYASGGLVRGFADGGFVSRFSGGGLVPQYLAGGGSALESFAARGSDTVPAMLTPGEFVMNAQSTGKFYSQLKAMNAGYDPAPRSPSIDQSQHGIIGDVNINIPGAVGPQATAREVIQAIRREQRRGSGNSLR